MMNDLFTNPLIFVVDLVAILLAITVHEFAHAWVADRLGDPTPRIQGRVTLNPRAHIDLTGLLFLFFFGFGWGKPVQFDPFNLQKPRQDAALISIAGPIANIITAVVCSLLLRIFFAINAPIASASVVVLVPMITLNLVLAVFNVLPIHPLDGFKIIGGILPREKAHEWYQLERYGFMFLLLMVIPFGGRSMLSMILEPVLSFLLPFFLPGFVHRGIM